MCRVATSPSRVASNQEMPVCGRRRCAGVSACTVAHPVVRAAYWPIVTSYLPSQKCACAPWPKPPATCVSRTNSKNGESASSSPRMARRSASALSAMGVAIRRKTMDCSQGSGRTRSPSAGRGFHGGASCARAGAASRPNSVMPSFHIIPPATLPPARYAAPGAPRSPPPAGSTPAPRKLPRRDARAGFAPAPECHRRRQTRH